MVVDIGNRIHSVTNTPPNFIALATHQAVIVKTQHMSFSSILECLEDLARFRTLLQL
jgi:hypothetical protein